jgi:hypothetical protein
MRRSVVAEDPSLQAPVLDNFISKYSSIDEARKAYHEALSAFLTALARWKSELGGLVYSIGQTANKSISHASDRLLDGVEKLVLGNTAFVQLQPSYAEAGVSFGGARNYPNSTSAPPESLFQSIKRAARQVTEWTINRARTGPEVKIAGKVAGFAGRFALRAAQNTINEIRNNPKTFLASTGAGAIIRTIVVAGASSFGIAASLTTLPGIFVLGLSGAAASVAVKGVKVAFDNAKLRKAGKHDQQMSLRSFLKQHCSPLALATGYLGGITGAAFSKGLSFLGVNPGQLVRNGVTRVVHTDVVQNLFASTGNHLSEFTASATNTISGLFASAKKAVFDHDFVAKAWSSEGELVHNDGLIHRPLPPPPTVASQSTIDAAGSNSAGFVHDARERVSGLIDDFWGKLKSFSQTQAAVEPVQPNGGASQTAVEASATSTRATAQAAPEVQPSAGSAIPAPPEVQPSTETAQPATNAAPSSPAAAATGTDIDPNRVATGSLPYRQGAPHGVTELKLPWETAATLESALKPLGDIPDMGAALDLNVTSPFNTLHQTMTGLSESLGKALPPELHSALDTALHDADQHKVTSATQKITNYLAHHRHGGAWDQDVHVLNKQCLNIEMADCHDILKQNQVELERILPPKLHDALNKAMNSDDPRTVIHNIQKLTLDLVMRNHHGDRLLAQKIGASLDLKALQIGKSAGMIQFDNNMNIIGRDRRLETSFARWGFENEWGKGVPQDIPGGLASSIWGGKLGRPQVDYFSKHPQPTPRIRAPRIHACACAHK